MKKMEERNVHWKTEKMRERTRICNNIFRCSVVMELLHSIITNLDASPPIHCHDRAGERKPWWWESEKQISGGRWQAQQKLMSEPKSMDHRWQCVIPNWIFVRWRVLSILFYFFPLGRHMWIENYANIVAKVKCSQYAWRLRCGHFMPTVLLLSKKPHFMRVHIRWENNGKCCSCKFC